MPAPHPAAAPEQLAEVYEKLRAEVRAFAETEVAPAVERMESTKAIEEDLVREAGRRGWIGVTIAPEYGGMGLRHRAKALIIEEISRVSAAMGAAVQASQLGTSMIQHLGSPEQHERWLPQVAAGDILPTIAVTEPGSGSHVLGMTSTARRNGDHYLVNGSKIFVGNSHLGGPHCTVVRTGPGSNGLTAFVIEGDAQGLTVPNPPGTLGLHGFSFGELRFTDCRVPVANRLRVEGDGLEAAYSSSLLYGRLNLAAVALGIQQALVENTAAYTTATTRYGKPLADQSTVHQRLGAMQAHLLVTRTLVYDAANRLDRGEECDAEVMATKLEATENVLASANLAMQCLGGAALLTEHPIQRLLRDAHHIEAPAGTSDIQRLRLADDLLDRTKGPQWSARYPQTLTAPQPSPRQEDAVVRPLRRRLPLFTRTGNDAS
ncbi:acyl-CoA dehydrogenase family protein [Streptacidiphilus fuscans]|uniref:Acyl-CoA/acyl-ACP dehydrogenase n=1 Tax=Streptacidiphilus fuscans TaxID=2789292 RepID=A0A931FFQ0_9ACTN|nr:acyl-CoA dehydrogenase family protein [Streptacidiphilus fuscans]MBF9071838.1 acyl-CoA/acyl-ACP dehydrogenase [Streptacidiphilus fuscans]